MINRAMNASPWQLISAMIEEHASETAHCIKDRLRYRALVFFKLKSSECFRSRDIVICSTRAIAVSSSLYTIRNPFSFHTFLSFK